MAMWALDSSNLKGIEYDESSETLKVFFVKGPVWSYTGLPKNVYMAFRDAPSAGKFYASEVKGKYPGIQVE